MFFSVFAKPFCTLKKPPFFITFFLFWENHVALSHVLIFLISLLTKFWTKSKQSKFNAKKHIFKYQWRYMIQIQVKGWCFWVWGLVSWLSQEMKHVYTLHLQIVVGLGLRFSGSQCKGCNFKPWTLIHKPSTPKSTTSTLIPYSLGFGSQTSYPNAAITQTAIRQTYVFLKCIQVMLVWKIRAVSLKLCYPEPAALLW